MSSMILRFLSRRTAILSIYVALGLCVSSNAADVVVLEPAGGTSSSREQLKSAIEFYGLRENVISVTDKDKADSPLSHAVADPQTVAVVMNADVLHAVNRAKVLSSLDHRRGSKIPVLIFGINEKTSPEILKQWSQGAVLGSKAVAGGGGNGFYQISSINGITRQLSGLRLPISSHDPQGLLPGKGKIEAIMSTRDGEQMFPVFARAYTGAHEIFFAASAGTPGIPPGPSPYREIPVFASLAPEMMFLRYAAGEKAWHSPGQYANFTIDDTWLREPYGYVNYEALLREMDKHNFHTTIAFIPWNFDRSQPEVAHLFRAHQDRYSICVHGNNHDHQEFGSYTDKPLAGQAYDIKQALARMHRFEELTRIPYDPVMVFPHSVSPEKTFALLKEYNFLATANSLNVPMDAEAPASAEFALRTGSMSFANFPSLRRYSAEAPGPPAQLAIDAFLGNPMLFYAHEAFFDHGIDAFDQTADTVNQLATDTEWRGLGYIAQHLYLEKRRDDGEFDVRLYGASVRLENPSATKTVFHIAKAEDFAFPVNLTVDGNSYPYTRSGGNLDLDLPIGAHAVRHIEITYGNDLAVSAVDISKRSLRVMALRRLSDFRDNAVSKTALGRWFIRLFVSAEAAGNKVPLAVLGLLMLAVIAFSLRRAKRRSSLLHYSRSSRSVGSSEVTRAD